MVGVRRSLKPSLIITMAGTIIIAVIIYGIFSMGSPSGASKIVLHFIGGISCLLWTLFGLTALARQLHVDMQGQSIPNTRQAMCFAWSRVRSLLLLPAWAVAGLLVLLLAELLVLLLARVPGLGLVWLALAGVPLLLLNTVVAVGLLLALFNIAARVAISPADAGTLRDILWRLLRQRLPELLIYNLGGVLATLFVAVLVLSPLWLGIRITQGLSHIVAGSQMAAVQAASGFWGGIAYLVALVVFGGSLAAIASIPGIVITHMTLLIHMKLDEPKAGKTTTGRKRATASRKIPARKTASRTIKTPTSRSEKKKEEETHGTKEDVAEPVSSERL